MMNGALVVDEGKSRAKEWLGMAVRANLQSFSETGELITFACYEVLVHQLANNLTDRLSRRVLTLCNLRELQRRPKKNDKPENLHRRN